MATKPIAGGSYEKRDPIPAGVHVARCVALYEIGTLDEEYQGQAKKSFKINLGFELPNCLMEFEENGQKVQKPAIISQILTLSAAEKSKLRLYMESWRGQKYKDGEFENVDLSKMLGYPCMLNITHTQKGDNTYANISTIMPVMQGVQVPPQVNPNKYLSYDNWNHQLFDGLPKFLKEMIQKTPEFAKVGAPAQAAAGGFAQAAQAAPSTIPAQGQGAYQQPQPVTQQQLAHQAQAPLPQQPQGGQWQPMPGASDISPNDGMPF